MKTAVRGFLFLLLFGLLASCDSAEDKAEKHYQSALELIQSGDEQRAIIEFRNVFKLNSTHKEARRTYAAFQRNRGSFGEAIGQYLRLVEQYPDDLDGQLAISEIYAEVGNWPDMERFLVSAAQLDAQNPKTRALQLVFDYRQAVADGNPDLAKQVADRATSLMDEMPDYMLLRQVEIDDHIRRQAFDLALLRLNEAIASASDNRALYAVRLSVLAALDDPLAIEAQLKNMIELFPEDPSSRETLVRWYVSQQQLDDAEKYLRDAAEIPGANVESQLVLIRFLSELRSPEAAQEELAAMIATGTASPVLNSLQAGYRFDAGDTDGAVAQLRELSSGLEAGEDLQSIKLALAQMLLLLDDEDAARFLVAEVLAENPENIAAIKLNANWLISDDRVGDAITALRGSLEYAPRDPEILGLLARAYQRDGNQSLVGDMLALAMEAANYAPYQTGAYARFMINAGKYDVAERALIDALRLAQDDVGILTDLGQVYLATNDWPRADHVRSTLEGIGTERARNAANELQARIFQGQSKPGEAIAFLKGLVEQGSAGMGAHVAIIESHLTNGQPEQAKSYVEALLADDPNNVAALFLDATLEVAVGNNVAAEEKYRSLLSDDPTQLPVWVALFRLLSATDRTAEAETAIDQAQVHLPQNETLLWIKAGYLENRGEIGAAIDIYEGMYARDSDNLIVANNLASLLSTASNDPASLERAYTIARRLRAAEFPAYLDTYGWIAHLRNENNEAIRALEIAATGMGEDAQVQYHLAAAYLAGKRESDALVQFRRVLDLTDGTDSRGFVEISRAEESRLSDELSIGENK